MGRPARRCSGREATSKVHVLEAKPIIPGTISRTARRARSCHLGDRLNLVQLESKLDELARNRGSQPNSKPAVDLPGAIKIFGTSSTPLMSSVP